MGAPSKLASPAVKRPTAPPRSKSTVTTLFASISCLAIILIFVIPPSSKILFPAFDQVRATGAYPDGVPIRREYTGNVILDFIFTGLAGFFSAAVDGKDEATHRFCLWFLPQLCGVLVFCYWESGRAKGSLVKLPMLVSILAQLATAGVILPVYFLTYARSMPVFPTTLPSEPVSRARTVFLSVALGYVAPSVALFLAPSGISLDTKQIIAAIWQPFPIYITILYNVFRRMDSALHREVRSPKTEAKIALFWIKCSYYACAVVSAVSHLSIVLPSLVTSDPAYSFANVLVPYYLHPYLPLKPTVADLPAYRLTVRLLFQHDWLTMTMAASLFFAWSHYQTRATIGPWIARMALLGVVGGPGAAISWAALTREERIFASLSFRKTS